MTSGYSYDRQTRKVETTRQGVLSKRLKDGTDTFFLTLFSREHGDALIWPPQFNPHIHCATDQTLSEKTTTRAKRVA